MTLQNTNSSSDDEPENSEVQYKILFEQAAVAIAISRGGKMVFVNKRFAEMLGYTDADEIIGRSMFEFVAPESQPEVQKRHENTPYDSKVMDSSELEATMVKRSGTRFIIHAAISNVHLPDGMASLAFVTDITQKKEAQEALHENELQLSELHKMMHLGNWIWDIKTGAVTWSDEVFKIFHLDPATFIPQIDSILELSPWPEDHARDKVLIRKAMESHETSSYEQRFLMPDKSTGYYQSTFRGKYDEDGTLVSIVGTILDITERKRDEETLKKNEAALKSLFNTTPVGLGLITNNKFTKVNNALCSILGYSEDLILDCSIGSLFQENAYEFNRVKQELLKQISNQGIGAAETSFNNNSGKLINAMVFLSPFNIEDPSTEMTISILDITELKKIQSEKSHLEEMLLHSQKMESIGRLAGGIAHDFNNQLMAIMGNTEMALEEISPDSKAYSRLKTVMQASESASNLTQQLLAFSRKQVIEPKIVNVNNVLERIRKMILTLIGESIKLDIVCTPDLETIKADPGQIEQIIINLAANARDAMPGGGRLFIETSNSFLDEHYAMNHVNIVPGPYVMIAVGDTGSGMSKEIQDKIFEPFFTTKEQGHGTGLGLATVYGIVKQSGGSIEVYSEIDNGTLFKLYLPVSKETEIEQTKQPEKKTASGGTETILIAEDNVQVLEFSSIILSRSGYKILTACSGEEALTVAENYPGVIDMFITDVILPGMNGRAAAEKLIRVRPAIKTLYNSGYTAEIIDKQGILEDGFNFISKPFTSQEILLKVRDILDKK